MNLIVEAFFEDRNFQEKLQEAVESISIEDEIDKAVSEHDTILNLIARVEKLEEVCSTSDDLLPKPTETSGKLKPIISGSGEFRICEDANYNLFFTHCKDIKTWEQLGLYRVKFPVKERQVTRYVLAESALRAVGQASCGLVIQQNDDELIKGTSVTRLPFMIQGWAEIQF